MSRAITFALAGAAALSASLTWSDLTFARGGGGGHFHGAFGAGKPPAYLIMNVAVVTDAEAFKKMMADLGPTLMAASAHLAVDAAKPSAWAGIAPQHVVVISFDSIEQAEAWKDTDAFKAFDAARRSVTTSTLVVVEGLPGATLTSGIHGRGRHMGFDMKPFEAIAKKNDQTIAGFKGICTSC